MGFKKKKEVKKKSQVHGFSNCFDAGATVWLG
jgi:hypothetical protein